VEWLTPVVTLLAARGGWGLFALGLILLMVAQWRGWIVGGAEHRRALSERDTLRATVEKQAERFDRQADTLDAMSDSLRTVETVVSALPRVAGRGGGRR